MRFYNVLRCRPVLDFDIQSIQQTKCLQQPQDYRYQYHHIEDAFDFAVHRDVVVDQPEQHTYDNQDDYDIQESHNEDFKRIGTKLGLLSVFYVTQ